MLCTNINFLQEAATMKNCYIFLKNIIGFYYIVVHFMPYGSSAASSSLL
jgi:hypothetical protein